ncbi:MAG: hypothetical protein AAFR36_09040 [Bacteroidota bacterium]
MRTQMPKFVPTFFFLFLLLSALFITACDGPEDNSTPIIEEPKFPDPIEDLVAYLSSTMGVLMVDPEFQDEIIEMLELSYTTNGLLERQEITPDGETRFYLFELWSIPAPELYHLAKEEMELEERPRQVDGIWYRVWKNAECGEKIKKKSGQCEELAQTDPQTGAVARQHKIETEHKRCEQGEGRCPEKLLPVGKTYFYDKLCKDEDTPDGQQVGDAPDFLQYRCDY